MRGRHLDACQLAQQLVTLLEANHRPPRPTMRKTPGESDAPSTPSARSRGQKPASQGAQLDRLGATGVM